MSSDIFVVVNFGRVIITNRRALEKELIYDRIADELECYGISVHLVRHLVECNELQGL